VMADNLYNFGISGTVLGKYPNSVDTSNLVDGKPVYYFVNRSGVVVNANAYPKIGYLGFVNCANVTVQGLNLTSNVEGLLFVSTNDSKIIGNNIANNFGGIVFESSSGNTLFGNNVTASSDFGGVWLNHSSNNVFWHNDFVNNKHQVGLLAGSVNVWDNGIEGNYWSNYNGTDLHSGPYQNETGSDGIGDTPYTIDSNNTDHYPLMGMFHQFSTLHGQEISVVSNSSISNFNFSLVNWTTASLTFNVTGNTGTHGFCQVNIPKALINGSLTVMLDGKLIQEPQFRILPASNQNYICIYINYTHSEHTMEITGTTTVPEFPSLLIMPLLIVTTLLAVIVYRKRGIKNRKTIQIKKADQQHS
jgi:parallel beta-helix repeat protein